MSSSLSTISLASSVFLATSDRADHGRRKADGEQHRKAAKPY
jgi:hypothetical protein